MIKTKKVYLVLVLVLAVFFVLGFVTPVAAQELSEREQSLEELRTMLRALPEVYDATEADRPAIQRANKSVADWMAKYNGTTTEICALAGKLEALNQRLGVLGVALPATGGFFPITAMGLLSIFAGAALLIPRKRRQ